MNVFEIFGKMSIDGLDKTKDQLSGLEQNLEKVRNGMKIAGAAFTAMGAASLAMIQSTKKINAALGVTALNLGVTTKEMRDLTLATTNVTFPIDEVTASFDLLARAGVKDTEVLQATATAFDTLGDATGKSASEVTSKMVPAMKTFGLTAEEVAAKSDAMTYLIRNSTVSMDNFGSVVGYITPELVEMGLTMDDTIALMGLMESKGMSGEVATRAFRTAITEATREGISLAEALGITAEEMAIYQEKLDGATGLTEIYADAANEQYTLMDKLKQKWSELSLKASAFLEPLEPVLAGMTALGPLMIGLSSNAGIAAIKWTYHTAAMIAHKIALITSAVAIKLVTAAQWLWNAALTANPIGIVVVAIGALIAAGVLLWKNWEKVTAFFTKAWDGMRMVVATVTDWITDRWNSMIDWFKGIPGKIGDIFAKVKDLILAPFRAAWIGIGEGINWLINQLNKINVKIPDWLPGIGGKEFGVNIPPITLPTFGKGGIITEPTILYGLKSQRPYAMAGESGREYVTPGGQSITVNIIEPHVRNDRDIDIMGERLIARLRQKGVKI